MRLRSGVTFAGMQSVTPKPSAAPSIANAIPVLPEVASSRRLLGVSSPRSSATRTMFHAGRSFTEPPGLNHSALP